jgi:hypothetical protein
MKAYRKFCCKHPGYTDPMITPRKFTGASSENEVNWDFPWESAGFGGVSVRPHAHTPKSGYQPRQFLKSQD